MTITEPRIIVALDFADQAPVWRLLEELTPRHCRLKVGKELFTRYGPQLVEKLASKGYDVFLDLKFHDIPTTTARACKAAAELGVWMINVHALGGRAMMTAAREALESEPDRPLLVAVTVLTSLDDKALAEIGLHGSARENVMGLAGLASHCGLDGVVCSPREAGELRQAHGTDFCLVTPGIRPAGAQAQDQQRTLTPAEAVRLGADYLVVGRPVTQADNPVAVLEAIQAELGQQSPMN